MAQKYFIAGTDTGVGKTLSSAVLLQAANNRGLRSLGLKPVAAGADPVDDGPNDRGYANEDAQLLIQYSSVELPYAQVNPVLLKEAIAPHIAADHENKQLTVSRLAGYCRGALMTPADLVLVEGAGGWRVPLNRVETLADLAKELQLPVILVVGMRLGCINHALLSVEAIQNDGLQLAGWIANRIDPQMSCYEENLATLRQSIRAPLLAELPYRQQAEKIDDLAHCFDQSLEYLLNKN